MPGAPAPGARICPLCGNRRQQFRTEELTPDLERLLAMRACYVGGLDTDFVFLPTPTPKSQALTAAQRAHGWDPSLAFRRCAQNHLPEYAPDGMFLHALRHVVATDIVKNEAEDPFGKAAIVLHNNPQMIQATYAHLRGDDLSTRARHIMERLRRERAAAPVARVTMTAGTTSDVASTAAVRVA